MPALNLKGLISQAAEKEPKNEDILKLMKVKDGDLYLLEKHFNKGEIEIEEMMEKLRQMFSYHMSMNGYRFLEKEIRYKL